MEFILNAEDKCAQLETVIGELTPEIREVIQRLSRHDQEILRQEDTVADLSSQQSDILRQVESLRSELENAVSEKRQSLDSRVKGMVADAVIKVADAVTKEKSISDLIQAEEYKIESLSQEIQRIEAAKRSLIAARPSIAASFCRAMSDALERKLEESGASDLWRQFLTAKIYSFNGAAPASDYRERLLRQIFPTEIGGPGTEYMRV